MSLPTRDNLLTLDWVYKGQSFARVSAKAGIETDGLDITYRGQPFWSITSGEAPPVTHYQAYWKTLFDVDQEVYVTLTVAIAGTRLWARMVNPTGGGTNLRGYYLEYTGTAVELHRYNDVGSVNVTIARWTGTLSNGDKLWLWLQQDLCKASVDTGSGWTEILSQIDADPALEGGYIGIEATDVNTRLDDFGGGGLGVVSLGTLSTTLENLSVTGTGVTQPISKGIATVTLDPLTVAGTGTYTQYTSNGSLNATLQDLTVAGTGTLPDGAQGSLNLALQGLMVLGTGTVQTLGTLLTIDHHYAGDNDEYTSLVSADGDLAITAAAGLAGTGFGLAVTVNDTTADYGIRTLTYASTEGRLRGRFYIDPNGLTMVNSSGHIVLGLYNATGSLIARIALNYYNGHQIQGMAYNDSNAAVSAPTVNISDAPHWVEFYLQRATTPGGTDGRFDIWVDGANQQFVTLPNYTQFSNFKTLHWGATQLLDATTSGTYYLDELVINNTGDLIGPIPQGILSATLGNLTVSGTAKAEVQGSASATLANLTLSGTTQAEGRGILNATLADLTVAGTGIYTQYTSEGTLSQTLEPLTVAGTAKAGVQGTTSALLADLTLVATGTYTQYVSEGTLAQTLGALTATAAAQAEVRGTLTATLEDLTATGTGTVTAKTGTGSLNVTLEDLTLSGTGIAQVSGTLSATLAELTASETATVQVQGSLSATLEDLTLAATGSYQQYTSEGTFAQTLEALTATASAQAEVRGSTAVTLGELTATGTGTAEVQASLTATLDELTASATVISDISGSLTTTLADLTSTATATSDVSGSLSATLADLTVVGYGKATTLTGLVPIQDIRAGGWTSNTGGPLYEAVNEPVADGSDYIQSELSPAASVVVLALEGYTDPLDDSNHALCYEYGKLPADTTDTVSLTVELRQGYVSEAELGTLIASWFHADLPVGSNTAEQALTEEQASTISDYPNLFVRMVAEVV